MATGGGLTITRKVHEQVLAFEDDRLIGRFEVLNFNARLLSLRITNIGTSETWIIGIGLGHTHQTIPIVSVIYREMDASQARISFVAPPKIKFWRRELCPGDSPPPPRSIPS